MRLYAVAMIWYTFGLLISAIWAEYTLWGWNEMFWIWDKCSHLILLLLIWHRPRETPGLGVLISFALARLLEEIFIICTGWEVNNIQTIRVLFMVYLAICLFWLLKELVKWRRLNS